MAGKMVEHFTGEQLYTDWVETLRVTTPVGWANMKEPIRDRWESFAVRLNTKVHAGVTPSIDPASYLAARGVTVDADAQDTYTGDDQVGPGFTTLTLGSDGAKLS